MPCNNNYSGGFTMLVRILTENKNYSNIMALIKQYFDSATVITTNGLWQGIFEHGLIIELNLPLVDKPEQIPTKINRLCFDIKKINKQDKILVQYIECNSQLI